VAQPQTSKEHSREPDEGLGGVGVT
jgi:hypothetical protein